MKISLPDVNILIALVAEGHTHHVSAKRWFLDQPDHSVVMCRVSQMGLLRLLTNPKVLLSGVCSTDRAWNISNNILADSRVSFEHEPSGLEALWAELMAHPRAGSSSWTDSYLAAFARRHGHQMVTFDRGFQRWDAIELTLLTA